MGCCIQVRVRVALNIFELVNLSGRKVLLRREQKDHFYETA